MSEVIHLPVISIYELRNLAVTDINEHYSNGDKVMCELDTLIKAVTKSRDCNLGAELLMCLDEFNGAEFSGDMWWIIYTLRSAQGGKVLWYGV